MDANISSKTTLLNTLETRFNNQQQEVNLLSTDIEELKESNKKVKEYAEKFQCSKCNKILSTIQRKEGHEENCTLDVITEVNNQNN